MILLQKIQLSNFLSHDNTTIEFKANEKLLLDGVSGAGKSAILDAIIWCLYGQSRADNRALVRKGAEKAQVNLTLRMGEETVQLTRCISSGGRHTLDVVYKRSTGDVSHPSTGLKELQHWIEHDLVGASYLLFVNSVAYVQGNAESFVGQSAANRRELLLEIVKAEDYDQYYEKAREVLTNEETARIRILDRVRTIEEWSVNANKEISKEDQFKLELDKNQIQLSDISKQRTEWVDKKSEYVAARNSIQTMESIADVYKRNVKEQEEVILNTSERIKELPQIEEDLKGLEPIQTRIEELNPAITEMEKNLTNALEIMARKPNTNSWLNTNRTQAEVRIKELQDSHKCPSGVECPHEKDIPQKIEALKAEVLQYNTQLEEEAKIQNEWLKEYSALTNPSATKEALAALKEERDTLQLKVAKMPTKVLLLNTIKELQTNLPKEEAKLLERKNNLLSAEKQVSDAKKVIDFEAWDALEKNIDNADVLISGLNTHIINLKASLEGIDRMKAENIKIANEVVQLARDLALIEIRVRKLELVKDAFGTKGIKAVVLDYMLPKLEDSINEVLSMLSDFRIRLDTQQAKVNDDGIKEGLFITIINDSGDELPYEAYSGGEKLKIMVAISEALATLQNIGFRIFDETFLGLDENSTEAFANVLDKLQSRFSQVLCVSHLLLIKEMFDNKIVIRKHNGVSSI